jgi:hypothetical protein
MSPKTVDAQKPILVTRRDLDVVIDIISTNSDASPVEQDKGGEETAETEEQASKLVGVRERVSVSGGPVHSDRLDAVASSPSWPDLKNNEASCSKQKTISE